MKRRSLAIAMLVAVLAVSADAHGFKRAASVARQGDEIQLLKSMRDQIVAKLAHELTQQVKTQAQTARG